MRRAAPPLRFLGVVLGGWVCLRILTLAPAWWPGDTTAVATPSASARRAPAPPGEPAPLAPRLAAAPPSVSRDASLAARPPALASAPAGAAADAARAIAVEWPSVPAPAPALAAAPLRDDNDDNDDNDDARLLPALAGLAPEAARTDRWRGAAWLLLRGGDRPAALAPGGTLGGSQAGARLLFRLNDDPARPLAASMRLYLPLGQRPGGSEIAAGLDWRPLQAVPVHLLAERRQRVGRDGREAFALTLYSGRRFALTRAVTLDGYAQAGVVGLHRRDLFVDGSARLAAGVGPVEIGAGLWAAAQPGLRRLDVGPSAAIRLPDAESRLRLVADWRFRLAGNAAPDSGPALTLASDF